MQGGKGTLGISFEQLNPDKSCHKFLRLSVLFLFASLAKSYRLDD